jgi:enoyl-CoA hydratase/carnithine racemase
VRAQSILQQPGDANGNYLSGGNAYKLNLPKRIPVDLFWSVTVYDALTASGLDNGQPFPSINSMDKPAANADGSIDIYFSPTSPGVGRNWLQTIPDKDYFVALRLYGPTEAFFNQTWRANDLQKIQWLSAPHRAHRSLQKASVGSGGYVLQTLENIANIRVPVIAAVEGRAHIHSDYALLADVIVAAEGATFQDVGHFAVGVTPGDGIFRTWSYRAGAGRAEAFLLNPQPLPARTAYEWGVVAEVVPNGKAVARARELADLYLRAPEVTRRNTRIHFIQPLKERIVREVGYGLSLEGASSADLAKSKQSKSGAVT